MLGDRAYATALGRCDENSTSPTLRGALERGWIGRSRKRPPPARIPGVPGSGRELDPGPLSHPCAARPAPSCAARMVCRAAWAPADHELGWWMALDKLAGLVEAARSPPRP
jgi:hypothetical protein